MAMALDLFAGVALDFALVALVRAVQKVKEQSGKLKPKLEEMEGTLKLLEPVIKKISELNRQLGEGGIRETEGLTRILEDGEKLVLKCSNVKGWWNILRRSSLYEKLMELENKLFKFLLFMQLFIIGDLAVVKLDLKVIKRALNYLIQLNEMNVAALNQPPPSASNGVANSDQSEVMDLGISIQSDHSALDLICVTNSYDIRPSKAMDVANSNRVDHSASDLSSNECSDIRSRKELDCRAFFRVVIGSVFVGFESVFLNVKNDDMAFRFKVQQLEDTIESLSSAMETEEPNIKGLNRANERERENIMRMMEDGKRLVEECSEVEEWDFVKRWEYQRKVVQMDNKLLRFHSFQLQEMNQEQLYVASGGVWIQ